MKTISVTAHFDGEHKRLDEPLGLESIQTAELSTFLLKLAYNGSMTQVEHLKTKIEALSPEDFSHLREWMAEKDWALWDEKLEKDAASGKLDFLREEAASAKAKGQLRDL